MKILIVAAMQEELDSIINELGVTFKSSQNHKFSHLQGNYKNHELALIICGIGKVNAAIATQHMIDKFNPELVINIGVAGSLSSKVNFGDIVIANDLVHHDMDVTEFGIKLGQVPRLETFSFQAHQNLINKLSTLKHDTYTIHIGRIVSGDQFINSQTKATFLAQEFDAIACEMEGAAIAHTCHINQVPFLVIRSMSDQAGLTSDAIHSFTELKEMAASRASEIVSLILNDL